jgi:spoIIIJ-associated protein
VEWVEVTGRTVEEAKDAALDQLGVDESDAEFEVLEEPKAGLFGRLRAEARVRARVAPTAPRPKVDRRERRRPARGGGRGERAEKAERSPAPDKVEKREKPEKPDRAVARKPATRPADTRGETMSDDPTLAEEGQAATEFLQGLLSVFGRSGQVQADELDEDTVEVSVEGDDLGVLIGPKGQTLAAIQELTRTAVQHRLGGRSGRLLIDISGYRARRRAALEIFTQQVADEVIDSGTARALEPMSAADRKVVHDTVNTIVGVATTSEGEEPRRRVVIAPADADD